MEEFSSPDWDSVPDVHLDGRSILQYPDPHPEFTAEMWDRHRANRKKKHAEAVLDKEEASEEDGGNGAYKDYHPPVITKEAEEFDEPCRPLATILKIAVKEEGWELVELAHAESTSEGKPYGTGEKAGQARETRYVDLQWLKVEKEGVGRALVVYPVVNGKVLGTRVSRRFNGNSYGDADMKKILRGTYVKTQASS